LANSYYVNWEQLISGANRAIERILKNEVAEEVEKILREHIKKDIYDAHQPIPNGWVNHTTYQRRFSLLDELVCISEQPNEIIITSIETPNTPVVKGYTFVPEEPGSFLKMLGTKRKKARGIWRKGFPRPAVNLAQKEIMTASGRVGSRVSDAINRGIKREFY